MPGAPIGELLEDRHVVDELEHREAAVEAGLLRKVAEPAADLQAVVGGLWVATEKLEPASVRRQHGGQDPQQRGLAGTVGAEQPGYPHPRGEVDAVERAGAA